jgi:hypothetical protein
MYGLKAVPFKRIESFRSMFSAWILETSAKRIIKFNSFPGR